MKKLMTVLITCLILVGCTNKDTTISYVMPAAGENTLEIDETNKAKLEGLSKVLTLENNDLKALDVDLNNISEYLNDINCKKVDLEGVTIVEVVATWCGFCQTQSKEYNSKLTEKYKDYKFVQYFSEQEESIEDFYKNLDMEVPNEENLHIVEKNADLNMSLNAKLDLEYFPTTLVLVNGQVKLMFAGLCDENTMDLIAKYLENPVSDVKLNEVVVRTIENVKTDIGEEAVKKLQEIEDSAHYGTVDVALRNMGKRVNDIDTRNTTVLFVNYLENSEFYDLVRVFKEKNPSVDVIVWTQDATSEDDLPEMKDITQYGEFNVPDSIKNELVGEYLPVAFYFENGICTGAISMPNALSTLNTGLELFIGSKSIARIG